MFSWFLTWCDAESSMWCTCCRDSSCYVWRSLVSCWWDTLVVVMYVFEIPFLPCWQDVHHACFCVILIGVFWLGVLVVEHLLEPLLRERIFLVWSWHHLLCTSPLLTALNAAAYTILTSGPGDVVPPGWTPLSTTYVFMLLMNVMFLLFTTCRCIH